MGERVIWVYPIELIIYSSVLAFVIGAVFGSFINCQAYRIAHKEAWWKGRSHCATCNHELGALDLVPIFSYLFLKGRCRYCGEKISPRYMITELVMGLALVVLFFVDGFSIDFLLHSGLAITLLGISLVDLEIMEIPNGYLLFDFLWWLGLRIFAISKSYESVSLGQLVLRDIVTPLGVAFLFGAVLLILSLIMDHVLKKESFGGGDIKLLFITALYLGFWNQLFMLILACIIGLLIVVIRKKNKIPFGPSIAAATYFQLTVGFTFTTWYLSLL